MNHKKIVIMIHFNSLKYSEARLTKEWIENRLDIFERFTLKSIKIQTNQDFDVYLQCDKASMSTINECLSAREPLPANVHFENRSVCQKEILKGLDQYEYLYWVRLDSDNLYHKDFIDKLHQYSPKEETEVLISQNGYIYDGCEGTLASYYQPSPPFYAYIYKAENYIKGDRYNTPGGHGSVIKLHQYELIEGNNYIVTLHGKNVSNDRRLINRELIIEGSKRGTILSEFGLDKEI